MAKSAPDQDSTVAPTHFEGRCFCNKLTYTINTLPTRAYLCHCQDCRRSSGSSYAHQAWFLKSSLQINDNSSKLVTFGSDADGSRQFCGHCGTLLFSTVPDHVESLREIVIVCVGTINGSEEMETLKPIAEGWCKRREIWLGKIDGAEQVDEW